KQIAFPTEALIVRHMQITTEDERGVSRDKTLFVPVQKIVNGGKIEEIASWDDIKRTPEKYEELILDQSFFLQNARLCKKGLTIQELQTANTLFPRALINQAIREGVIPPPGPVWNMKTGETSISLDKKNIAYQWDQKSPIDFKAMVVLWWTSKGIPYAGALIHFRSNGVRLDAKVLNTANVNWLPRLDDLLASWPSDKKPPSVSENNLIQVGTTYATDKMPLFYKIAFAKRLKAAGIPAEEFVFPEQRTPRRSAA
ncbi:MAG: hypothetical protein NT091_05335, partial [Candidatus Falkowbacteria bacterium]|nr:hypothetical protein [Candidatus Falkowbacteria bacterium]